MNEPMEALHFQELKNQKLLDGESLFSAEVSQREKKEPISKKAFQTTELREQKVHKNEIG